MNILSQTPWMTIKADVDNKTAEIDIFGFIGWDFEKWLNDERQNTTEDIRKETQALSQMDFNKYVVNINTLGGDSNHGVSIHDLLATCKAEIITNITGNTASAGTVISQSGNTRRISANALFLVHKSWTPHICGSRIDLKQAADSLEKIDNQMRSIYSKRSGKAENEIESLMNEANGQGIWLTANEAKEWGLVDEIYEPMEAAACAAPINPEVFSRFGLPELPEAFKNKITNNQKEPKNMAKSKEETQKPAPQAPVASAATPQAPVAPNAETSAPAQPQAPATIQAAEPIKPIVAQADANSVLDNFKKMKAAFGTEIAAQVLEEGGSYSDAQAKYIASLENENKELKAKQTNAQVDTGEEPAAFQAPDAASKSDQPQSMSALVGDAWASAGR